MDHNWRMEWVYPIRFKYYLDYDRGTNIFPLFYSYAYPKHAPVKEEDQCIFFLEEDKKLDLYHLVWNNSTGNEKEEKEWVNKLFAVLTWDEFIS